MWQIYAYLAHDHIEEQLAEARRQRRPASPEHGRAHSRLRLPASLRHPLRASSRTA